MMREPANALFRPRRRRIPSTTGHRMLVVTGTAFLIMSSMILPPIPLRTTNALLTSTTRIVRTSSLLKKGLTPLSALLQESDQREKEFVNGDSRKKDDDEFTLHIGRALDTLRQEYPHILTQSPDFSLYDPEMEFCMDLPAAPLSSYKSSIHGVARYKMVWDLIHGMLRLFYHTDQSYMSSVKLCHDRVRGNVVRVQWHAVLFPRWQKSQSPSLSAASPPPPSSKCHHIDGISVYELDWQSGKIVQHRVEQLVYTNNAQPVMMMEEVLLRHQAAVAGGTIPVQSSAPLKNTVVEFQSRKLWHSSLPTSLFAMEAEQPSPTSKSSSASASSSSVNAASTGHSDIVVAKDSLASSSASSSTLFSEAVDMAALEAKNKSRLKFGLKPLTPTEFLQVQKEVLQLATIQKEKALEASVARQEELQQQRSSEDGGGGSLFDKVFGSVVKNLDTCESNFDCVRPQVCCDYVFAKKCCTSGSLVSSRLPAYAPIPVYAGDPKLPPQSRR